VKIVWTFTKIVWVAAKIIWALAKIAATAEIKIGALAKTAEAPAKKVWATA